MRKRGYVIRCDSTKNATASRYSMYAAAIQEEEGRELSAITEWTRDICEAIIILNVDVVRNILQTHYFNQSIDITDRERFTIDSVDFLEI